MEAYDFEILVTDFPIQCLIDRPEKVKTELFKGSSCPCLLFLGKLQEVTQAARAQWIAILNIAVEMVEDGSAFNIQGCGQSVDRLPGVIGLPDRVMPFLEIGGRIRP